MKSYRIISILFTSLALLMAGCIDEKIGAEELINSDITVNTTWTSSKVYVIEGYVTVDANLTIEPGTTIKFKSGATLVFGTNSNSTVLAVGTPDERIVFTSYSETPTPGAWSGLVFHSNTLPNSTLSYCDIEYAGQNDYDAVGVYCKLNFTNNRVLNAKNVGIFVEYYGSFGQMIGNTVDGCGTHAIAAFPLALHTIGELNLLVCNPGYGILVKGGFLNVEHSTSATWRKQTVPYIISENVWVNTNLTIEAGTQLHFDAFGSLAFGVDETSTVKAVGTLLEPIVFTSSNATPAPGAWYGVEVSSHTNSNSVFEFCQFSYAGKGDEHYNANLYFVNVDGLTVRNCTFSYSRGYGINLYNSSLSPTSTGNVFIACSGGNIYSE